MTLKVSTDCVHDLGHGGQCHGAMPYFCYTRYSPLFLLNIINHNMTNGKDDLLLQGIRLLGIDALSSMQHLKEIYSR